MKKRDLIRALMGFGWHLLRQGGQHEIWTDGEICIAIPRHREIAESTARRILRKAQLNSVSEKNKP
ncbi:MAG: type II toxin-antitoxin system HicA family toxin [Pseudomonadota bacterium]